MFNIQQMGHIQSIRIAAYMGQEIRMHTQFIYGIVLEPTHTPFSLSSDIQAAACNENIRLATFLFGGLPDGSWYVMKAFRLTSLNAHSMLYRT